MTATPLPVPCTRSQAVAALGEPGLNSALRNGRLRRIWHDLFVPADRARDQRTRARAALLLAGEESALTGPTAAEVYGWLPPSGVTVHVAQPLPHRSRPRPGLALHPAEFTAEDVLVLDGLRLLTPAHVLAQLLIASHPRALSCVRAALTALPPDLRRLLGRDLRTQLARWSRPPEIRPAPGRHPTAEFGRAAAAKGPLVA